MPKLHHNHGDQHDDDGAERLDLSSGVERSWSGVAPDGGPLTVRAQVRIVTGPQARAVAAAQGRALLALLKAYEELAGPRGDTDEEEAA
jgi:hypothetical protein